MALRFRALIFLVLFVCPVLCAPPGIEVCDQSGAIIPNARVDVFGRTLRVSAPGFAPRTVTLAEGEQSVRVTLEPAPVVTSIDVVVRQAPLESGTAATSTTLEIERTGARTVFDAIDRLVPSAFVTRRGVMGYGIATNGTGGVNIRGIGGSPNTGVLVVVDGRPDFQGLMGHPLPDLYSLSDTASVRITQGPASVLYGSNAMGGAIEIQPSRPEAGFETRLTSSLGSYWTTQNRLHHAANFEKSFYSLNAGYSGTSGDRPSSDFRNPDATAAFGYDLSSHWKTSLQGRYGYFHVEDPGPWTAPLSNSYANVGRGGYDLSFANAYGKSHGSGHVYGAWGRHFITDGFRSTDSTQGARVMQSFLVAPSVTVDAGADFNNYGGVARNIRQRLDYGHHELREGAGFARRTVECKRAAAAHRRFPLSPPLSLWRTACA